MLLASSQPLASVYLSQIPYTGLDLGPVGTIIYWLTLIVWSLAAAYLVLFTGVPFMLRRAKSFGSNVKETLNAQPEAAPVPMPAYVAPAPVPAYVAPAAPAAHIAPVPMFSAAPAGPSQSQLSREGFKSFATGDVLTIDDIVKGLSRESGMVFSQHDEEPAIAAHMDTHAANVEAIAAAEEPKAEVVTTTYAPSAPITPAAPVAAPITYSDDIAGFLSVLLSGDREAVFGTLRTVNRAGGDTQDFLAHAVCALDDAYRARIDGTSVHPEIARITSDCATNFLERLVSSLATAIDSSYSAGITGAKLAATRALAIVNG